MRFLMVRRGFRSLRMALRRGGSREENEGTFRLGWPLARLGKPAKAGLLFSFIVLLAVAATVVYYFAFRPVVKAPCQALLRVTQGPAAVHTTADRQWVDAPDMTPLNPGDWIWAKEGAKVAIQHFGGSISVLEGVTEAQLLRCQEVKRRSGAREVDVAVRVVVGQSLTKVVSSPDLAANFEILTPTSHAVVQGTIFQVNVAPDGGTHWQVSEGSLRVVAVVPSQTGEPVVILVSLDAGEEAVLPSLPEALRTDPLVMAPLLKLAGDVARASLGKAEADLGKITVEGGSVLASNADTGTTVFTLAAYPPATPVPGVTPVPTPTPQEGVDPVLTLIQGAQMSYSPVVRLPDVPEFAPAPGEEIPPATPTSTPIPATPPEYLFSIYDVSRPLGVAVDREGERIYVTESAGHRAVRVFDRDGNLLDTLMPTVADMDLRGPTHVAVDGRGTVYVVDRLRHVIDTYDASGNYLGVFKPNGQEDFPWNPLGVAVDAADNLYVTEVTPGRHKVMVFEPGGRLRLQFGSEGESPGSFSFPNGVAVDDKGGIYVADSNNFRVQVFDANGKYVGVLGRGGPGPILSLPRGIGIDVQGRLYVVATLDHKVHVFDLTPPIRELFSFGSLGLGEGEFNFPNGFALDSRGRLYITDRESNRVQVWSY